MNRAKLLEVAQEITGARTSADRTADYIQRLEDMILELVTRTPEQADVDIQKLLAGLNNIRDTYILSIKVEKDYSGKFFLNEPDVEYKKKLARNLLVFMNSKMKGKYHNLLLEGIANEDSEYVSYLQSVLTEKV